MAGADDSSKPAGAAPGRIYRIIDRSRKHQGEGGDEECGHFRSRHRVARTVVPVSAAVGDSPVLQFLDPRTVRARGGHVLEWLDGARCRNELAVMPGQEQPDRHGVARHGGGWAERAGRTAVGNAPPRELLGPAAEAVAGGDIRESLLPGYAGRRDVTIPLAAQEEEHAHLAPEG